MKRKFFAVFAVLIAIMLITCDLVDEPAAKVVGGNLVTPDGRPMARLTINIGDGGVSDDSLSRAMTLANAKTSDLFEVAFKDPQTGDIYRSSKPLSAIGASDPAWTIDVPYGNYSTADKAIMLAGKSGTDKILLAIGKITTGANIDTATATVTAMAIRR